MLAPIGRASCWPTETLIFTGSIGSEIWLVSLKIRPTSEDGLDVKDGPKHLFACQVGTIPAPAGVVYRRVHPRLLARVIRLGALQLYYAILATDI